MSAFGDYWIEDDGKPEMKPDPKKPPYRVPLMSEIAKLPWNGFKVASTFSGAGGSCTGYRMAGFKVVWANEFVPSAQASYKANSAEDCILDTRDIKDIQPEEILKATGLKVGELDILDGSPPCQAFSTAGKREKGWGKNKTYEHGAKQKNETLFDHYIRLLRGLKPKVFIAENVSGLIKGVAKGYFLEILEAMKASGYRVTCRVLDAQWLGVPQQRQRIIFIGVREDLNLDPVHPKPLPFRYSVRDALPWIMSSSDDGFPKNKNGKSSDQPARAARAARAVNCVSRVIHASGGFSRTDSTERPMPAITATQCRVTVEGGIEQYAIGKEWDNIKPGEQSKKFFSLVKPSPTKPSPTIQSSHGEASIASVVHPFEKRKFTIAELKRICAFPDDFILEGSYAQQWACLGNAVPCVMMKAIAETVRDEILRKPVKVIP